jgi:Butirosin biosynthesis protein H, N-terminal/Domain of unknown function (DUF4872)
MAVLDNYTQFGHIHWETGTLAHALNYEGASLSEALLFGISGGIVAGYFPSPNAINPHLYFLTRNPFQPTATIIKRLALSIDDRRTSKPEKAQTYLKEMLEAGHPVIVWLDMSELPYTDITPEDGMLPQPILVYGYDKRIHIADRASVPLRVTPKQLAKARLALPDNRHRMMSFTAPDEGHLALAVRLGIESCIANFGDEAPSKRLQGKFGLDAYRRWARLLIESHERSWQERYTHGRTFYLMLTSAYESINCYGTGGNGSRAFFADFLDEAADILENRDLHDVAQIWRDTLPLWRVLNHCLLPDDIESFAKARTLLDGIHQLFLQEGAESLKKRRRIRHNLDKLTSEMESDFPLNQSQSAQLRERLHAAVLAIHDAESAAIEALRETMLVRSLG